jgi:folate-binding protein YgfZ
MTAAANAAFSELTDTGLIRASGADAHAFLHAQLTSDIAGLAALRTQYSGYCSPKGRLLATFLVWNVDDGVLLQLPRSLVADIRARLARYVLRSKVTLAEATASYSCFGISGANAAAALARLTARVPEHMDAIVASDGILATRLRGDRFMILVPAAQAPAIREVLATHAQEELQVAWTRLDIEQGIAVITAETQDQYVPQMVNLDLIGAVSYSKGCYPGQEIVARTHYLGRLKQRTYHIRSASPLATGDPLYSTAFGAEQASGTVLNAAPESAAGYDALAVIQTAAVASADLHWKSLDGPALQLQALPYPIPG